MSQSPSASRVQAVLDGARELRAEEVPAFLNDACGGDAALRGEVESLLGALSRAGRFLAPGQRPVVPAVIAEPEPVLTGRTIGPFAVGERIGVGGMGVVYKARDTRLGRTVALKVIRESLVHDPDRRERLEREARSLASLNHPNIGAIHSLEEFAPGDGAWVLVLEFVPGLTLAERIGAGPIPVQEALKLAGQMADALEAAHSRGIIHRDFKPGNIKITPEGTVKVLDFGLAKELVPGLPRVGSTSAPGTPGTHAIPHGHSIMTQVGLILGTPAYMSPEQARGRPVDRRTDLWAFGCVLYEMLTGTPAFHGETITDTIAAILRSEPDWSRLPPSTPSAARRLLRRCLEKDRDRRLRDAGDARLELDEAGADTGSPQLLVGAGWGSGAVTGLVLTAALIGVGLGIWGFGYGRGSPPPDAGRAVPTRMTIDLPAGDALAADASGGCMAISPDGRTLAFVAGASARTARLFVRRLDAFEAVELPGTRGAAAPCFSPDGKWIAYSDPSGRGEIKKVRVGGGAPVTVAPAPGTGYEGAGMCWGADDMIIFSGPGHGGLWRIPASGGTPEPLTELNSALRETTTTQPEVLPDARTILFTTLRAEADRYRLSVEALVVATGLRRRIVDDACQPQYLSAGHLLYYQHGALLSVRFDAGTLTPIGEPRKVLAPLAGAEIVPRRRYAVSSSGTLAYLPATTSYEATELAWFTLDGAITSVCKADGLIDSLRLSPDGTKVAYAAGPRMTDIWVRDLIRATTWRIAEGAGRFYPVWTPDGRRVAFQNLFTGQMEWAAADGTSGPEVLFTFPPSQRFYPNAFTPDAQSLVFTLTATPDGPEDLYVLRLDGDRTPQRVFSAPAYASRFGARLSPDGSLIAYTSEESGTMEVLLQPFPGLDRKVPVSSGGGFRSAWSGDGKTLYYRFQDRLYAVEVTTSPEIAVSPPRLVLQHLPESRYDAAPDGTRFMVAQTPGDSALPSRINVVQNWTAEAGLDASQSGAAATLRER